ncbi:hypothetical protein AB0N89_01695 [Amycolatopsis sp. NPDC089917]|uniref:hypothetical protein n=1 Tax=Amycolatopsis sp. NPDC089917 TaxID=3155187 RepID=UPI0034446139
MSTVRTDSRGQPRDLAFPRGELLGTTAVVEPRGSCGRATSRQLACSREGHARPSCLPRLLSHSPRRCQHLGGEQGSGQRGERVRRGEQSGFVACRQCRCGVTVDAGEIALDDLREHLQAFPHLPRRAESRGLVQYDRFHARKPGFPGDLRAAERDLGGASHVTADGGDPRAMSFGVWPEQSFDRRSRAVRGGLVHEFDGSAHRQCPGEGHLVQVEAAGRVLHRLDGDGFAQRGDGGAELPAQLRDQPGQRRPSRDEAGVADLHSGLTAFFGDVPRLGKPARERQRVSLGEPEKWQPGADQVVVTLRQPLTLACDGERRGSLAEHRVGVDRRGESRRVSQLDR